MSDESPAGVPGSSGNGQYIAVALVFLLLGGGLVAYKLKQDDKPPPPPAPSATAETAKPALTDAPPPPPPEETAAEPTPSATAKVATGGGPCSTTCSGSASSALASEVRALGGRAKSCYERALRQNPNLEGHMDVALKIDASGNVCSASSSGGSLGGDVGQCVAGMFRGKKFSPPNGGCVNMSLPLNFSPKK